MSSTLDRAPSTAMEKLEIMRSFGGTLLTEGLPDAVVERFLERSATLREAIDRAYAAHEALRPEFDDLLRADEEDQIARVQESIVNFYGRELVNPYVSLGASGPWIVTMNGAVLHDSGGYGMLGQGHTPPRILEALARPQVMANVMTPNLSQMRLIRALKREIGHRHEGGCPFTGFLFMNSGSESVTVAARISDINAKLMTDPGGRHAGKKIRRLALRGAFHGRTDRPAQFSDSSLKNYVARMATFRDREPLLTVEANDVAALKQAFADAADRNEFIEALFLEPVMGEGNPGVGITREFYDAARRLTTDHGSMLLVDSIQAGLRAHGVLSILDYPGFEDCVAPDMETYSKALNAGQYPLSVLAMTEAAAGLLVPGMYGNTMTSAPRAMDIGTAVLEGITPAFRENIRVRGAEFKAMLKQLAQEEGIDGAITDVQGTGLLVSCALDPARFKACGTGSTEEYLRTKGFGVIHGGANALRYTPHFAVTTEELRMIVDAIRDAIRNGPRRA